MNQKKQIGFFEKYLTVWVALCIAAGIGIGHFSGNKIEVLSSLELFRVNIPVAVLVWLMIYPMMLQVDFSSIKNVGKRPKGLILTLLVNWLIIVLLQVDFINSFDFKFIFHVSMP